MERRCLHCGSGNVVGWVRLVDVGPYPSDDHAAGFDANPAALMFKGTIKTPVRALVCGDCGYIALFATDARAFTAQFRESGRVNEGAPR